MAIAREVASVTRLGIEVDFARSFLPFFFFELLDREFSSIVYSFYSIK